MNLTNPNEIRRLMKSHGVEFSKSLGQNFIIDESICPSMAKLADCESGVIEIGTGVGVLTRELSKISKKVVAIELDSSLLPILAKTLDGCDNVFVHNIDFLDCDLEKLINEEFGGEKVSVCANLPYYITSPIIMKILENRQLIKSATLMVQREVADRLTAEIGSRDSGALTVAVNFYATAEKLFDVDKTAFMPVPKVNSAVIKLNMLDSPAVDVADEKYFFKVVKAAFSQRRKTAVNSLSSGLAKDKIIIENALKKLNLPLTIRPEALSLAQLAALSGILSETT
jgi:16S rRNA (adenine1518-N6/adenine1519-N6)-dimethyltransferase